MMDLDPLLLSRIQFGFTISFHILFPSFTIGLAAWLAVLEAIWLKTGEPIYKLTAKHWSKIFAVSFGLGVVSGLVLSYEFGTNWSVFSHKAGNVIGPLLSYEVLTAFFLEAGFLGIMLFGWDRVPKPVHFFATCMVALGTLISTFWIISANSWMQTPAGYMVGADGVFQVTDWWAVVFNPSFPYRLAHMVTAAYLTTAFAVGGIGAWRVLHDRKAANGRIQLGMALSLIVWMAPLQILLGDLHGLNALEHQPAKIAAVEANWDTQRGMPLTLFAIPDAKQETNHFEIAVPKLGSLILGHSFNAEIKGLKDFPPEDRANPLIPFFAFRLMVGFGVLMVALGLTGGVLWLRGRLFETRWFLRAMWYAWPIGFVAILAGWLVAENGRQPWIVYGVMRTADAVSPIPGASVALSLLVFILVYAGVFGAGGYYINRLILRGPDETEQNSEDDRDPSRHPMAAAAEA